MTKEQLIEKLEGILSDVEDANGLVEDIPITPLEDIKDLIDGKPRGYNSYSHSSALEKGALKLLGDALDDLEYVIDELKASV